MDSTWTEIGLVTDGRWDEAFPNSRERTVMGALRRARSTITGFGYEASSLAQGLLYLIVCRLTRPSPGRGTGEPGSGR